MLPRSFSGFVCALVLAGHGFAADWPAWRGPNANGTANGSGYPTAWSESSNILWKASVPGRGHSSPVIVGDKIFLTTADEDAKTQSVLCFDRKDGQLMWQTEVHRGGFVTRIHKKNTHASPTVASDGSRVFAVFNNENGIQLAALSMEGKLLWETTGGYVCQYNFGYGPSPLLYGSTVIVSSEYRNGYLAAYDTSSGKEVWRTSRPGATSYSSPIVANVGGREQLLLSGGKQISSFDPRTGSLLWRTAGGPPVTCGTLVWTENMIFASGGYPTKETWAVRADGSGVVWSNREKSYEQSMLVVDGYLYAVNDNSIAFCWRAEDGKEMWKKRIGGGPISASPVLANGLIYATNESGKTTVYRADPGGFDEVATNQLGDEAFATPAFLDGRIYARVADSERSGRQEFLYCIGTP